MTSEPFQQIDLFGMVTVYPTSSSAARRAKTSAAPTPKVKASKVSAAASTSTPSASSENAALVGSLLKTALISELGALTPSSLRWKHSATPAGRSWFVLATSEQITSDPDAGSSDATSNRLPTPVKPNGGRSLTVEAIETGKRANGAKAQIDTPNMLKHAFQMLPTPMASDGMKDGAGGGAGSTYPFRKILSETAMLPTPVKNDRKMEPWSEAYSRRRSPKLDALMDGASKFETLPTPTKRDKRMDAWSPAYDKRKSPTMDAVLDGAMTDRASDKWQYAREIAATLQNGGLTGQSMSLPVTYNWMMGFPPGWLARALRSALQKGLLQQVSSSKRSETPSSRKSPKQ
ncbi:hypothetical protein [Neorhizobium sp. NCHU2750]|uniref:hypothetical protein n=1 Tax=Neorhizobium sp. NCHU2750 TaxID=1825976 RepID=UPI000EB61346|nr:hypothetical protein NCHU2750_05960 [Neorhizobium sp. NCHU2750]